MQILSGCPTVLTTVLQTSRKGCLCSGLPCTPVTLNKDCFKCATVYICNYMTTSETVSLCDCLTMWLPWQTVLQSRARNRAGRKGCCVQGSIICLPPWQGIDSTGRLSEYKIKWLPDHATVWLCHCVKMQLFRLTVWICHYPTMQQAVFTMRQSNYATVWQNDCID